MNKRPGRKARPCSPSDLFGGVAGGHFLGGKTLIFVIDLIAVAGASVQGIAVSTNGSIRVISARAFGTSTIRSHR